MIIELSSSMKAYRCRLEFWVILFYLVYTGVFIRSSYIVYKVPVPLLSHTIANRNIFSKKEH